MFSFFLLPFLISAQEETCGGVLHPVTLPLWIQTVFHAAEDVKQTARSDSCPWYLLSFTVHLQTENNQIHQQS